MKRNVIEFFLKNLISHWSFDIYHLSFGMVSFGFCPDYRATLLTFKT